jgi:hypothetical protein
MPRLPAGVGQTAVWFPVAEGGAAADWRSYVTKAKGQSLPSAGALLERRLAPKFAIDRREEHIALDAAG